MRLLLTLAMCILAAMAGATVPMDLLEARAYCDSVSLLPAEGIWEYPEDGVTVLVRRLPTRGQYSLIAIDSDDTRVRPGDVIGTMRASADPGVFHLSLATRDLTDNLGAPAECLATLSKSGDALYVKMRKRTLSLSPSWILPRFWRIARIRTSDPLEKLPAGMVRIYPASDGNDSSPGEPRYL